MIVKYARLGAGPVREIQPMPRQQPRQPGASQSLPRVTVAGGPSIQPSRENRGIGIAAAGDEALRALVHALARRAAREHFRSRGFAMAEIAWRLIAGSLLMAALIALIGAER